MCQRKYDLNGNILYWDRGLASTKSFQLFFVLVGLASAQPLHLLLLVELASTQPFQLFLELVVLASAHFISSFGARGTCECSVIKLFVLLVSAGTQTFQLWYSWDS